MYIAFESEPHTSLYDVAFESKPHTSLYDAKYFEGNTYQIGPKRTICANEATHSVMKGKSGLPGTKRRDSLHSSVSKFSALFDSVSSELELRNEKAIGKVFVGEHSELIPFDVRANITRVALLACIKNCRKAQHLTVQLVEPSTDQLSDGVVHVFNVTSASPRPAWRGSDHFRPNAIYQETCWKRPEVQKCQVIAR